MAKLAARKIWKSGQALLFCLAKGKKHRHGLKKERRGN
jgi:hypothetical protein